MELLAKIHSKIDKTVKFVFKLSDGLITEASYIDKDDGKNIICVSSHTGCHLGCKFCHTTDCIGKVETRELLSGEIIGQIGFIVSDLSLANKMLLVSYMGCGEPLLNIENIIHSMTLIQNKYQPCRFAIATLLPSTKWLSFFDLTHCVQNLKLNVKIHLSLHFTNDKLREEWMPAAMPIGPSIAALEFYRKVTGQPVEIHYALIDGVNDYVKQAYALLKLIRNRDIPVKVLKYNERKSIDFKASQQVRDFMGALQWGGVPVEYYDPPGVDVGSSCGAFLLDYYLKYNTL